MQVKKRFTPNIQVDFSTLAFYEIPFPFFAQWLHLLLELGKIIQPGFHVDIPKKALDWYRFPDREVLDLEGGSSYILRTASLLLQNGDHRIHLLAQHGYEPIPGQSIIGKTNLSTGSVFSQNGLKNAAIDFTIEMN